MAGIGAAQNNITKLFVSNLPEGCTPLELRKCLEGFGVITGTFVAKKKRQCRNKLVKNLRGVKMGDFNIKINIARFAFENSGFSDKPEVKPQSARASSQAYNCKTSNFRDFRSYCDVAGSSKSASAPVKGWGDQKGDDKWVWRSRLSFQVE
ncbi:putative RNA recognition motif domain, nucleotide-binding alpha-beta plait domain superfamily [Helianthus anomalus]